MLPTPRCLEPKVVPGSDLMYGKYCNFTNFVHCKTLAKHLQNTVLLLLHTMRKLYGGPFGL